MRKLLTFALVLFSLSAGAKKENAILIYSDIAPEEMFVKAGKILLQNNYSFKNTDKDFLTLSTAIKDLKRCNVDFTVYVEKTENGSVLRLTGTMDIGSVQIYGIEDNSRSAIDNRGMKGSPARIAWDEMYCIAELLGDKIELKTI